MARRFLLTGLMFTLAACGANMPAESEPTAAPDADMTSAPVVQAQASATPVAAARSEKETSEVYEFEYSYPAEAAAIPGLKGLLDQRLSKARSELAASAQQARQEAQADGYPYRTYAGGTSWSVVTQTPRFLSLSAEIYAYSGGAHGMTAFDTLLWDKQAGKALEPSGLFTGQHALRDAIRQPFCKALDQERSKRRQGQDWSGDEMFSECIDPTASTVILGSSNGQAFDRIGVLVGPYEAGPYAEGTYEVTLPVTRAVLAAVKPVYRSAFTPGR